MTIGKLSHNEKEQKKILLAFHYAFVQIINQFTLEDFRKYNIVTNTARDFADVLYSKYLSFIEKCALIKEIPVDKVDLFDQAICLGLSLRSCNPIIATKVNSKAPQRVKYLQSELISNTMLAFLSASEYRLVDKNNKTLIKSEFKYDGYDKGHKLELKKLKKELTQVIYFDNFDYIKCLDIIKYIYGLGVIYKEELKDIDVSTIIDNLRIMGINNKSFNTPDLTDDYRTYLKLKKQ